MRNYVTIGSGGEKIKIGARDNMGGREEREEEEGGDWRGENYAIVFRV